MRPKITVLAHGGKGEPLFFSLPGEYTYTMPGQSGFEPLDEPFFTLEYDPGTSAFIRKIPEGAEDLSGGRFRYRGRLLGLGGDPAGEEAPLRKKTLGGKEMLAMARRGYGPLIRSGPVPAGRGERLMELALKTAPPVPGKRRPGAGAGEGRAGVTEITILPVYKVPEENWLPLEGLPNYRLFQNRVYEIIPGETLDSLFPNGRESGGRSLTLKGWKIPAFADLHARLIYVFADTALYRLLSQENLFVPPEKLSLSLRCAPVMERGVGMPIAAPALRYIENRRLFLKTLENWAPPSGGTDPRRGDQNPGVSGQPQFFSALALSRQFRSAYIALGDKWVRRESLEQTGIGPLGRYVNGESLEPFVIKARSLFSRGVRFRGLWGEFEFDRDRWRRYGSEKEIFCAHLDYLRAWGFSGGVVSGDREKTAAFLAAWLKALAAELEREGRAAGPAAGDLFGAPLPGRVLVLMKKNFWERWLEKELPQSGEGPRTVPAGNYSGAASLGDPRFRGIGLGFYGDFLKPPPGEWDMLILTGPEEALVHGEPAALDRDMLRAVEAVKARLRLGIFFSAGDLLHNPLTKDLRAFFGLRGNRSGGLTEIEKYLVRETGEAISPPMVKWHCSPAILRPPFPWRDRDEKVYGRIIAGGGRFLVEDRFRDIRSAEYRAEQECFFRERKRRPPHSGPSGSGGSINEEAEPDFNRLSPEERELFFWWRSEFREGRNREAGRSFLVLYARELILLMGGKPEKAFEELRRLWTAYREVYPDLDRRFPRWLLDFGILYRIREKTISTALFGFPPPEAGLLGDLYLHRKYIEENNSLAAEDFEALLPGGSAFSRLDFSAGLVEEAREAFGAALNTIDRFLRQGYGKKLLEFFYPLPARKENAAAFEGLAGLGNSAYTAEWLSFSAHKPLLSFLSSVAAFLEYRLLREKGFKPPGNPPYLDPLWKYLAGLDEEGAPPPEELGLPQVELEQGKITRLREESDAVRDLLRIEPEEELPHSDPPPRFTFPSPFASLPSSPSPPDSPLSSFLEGLSGTERKALELIAQGRGRKDLEELARAKGTMTELILDGINGRFMEDRGDLLLEISPDEDPRIQAEYRDEVLRHTKDNGV
jgi:hypothetical protein